MPIVALIAGFLGYLIADSVVRRHARRERIAAASIAPPPAPEDERR
ncbi:MAG: hypothetical protein H0W83_04440, partial [Planctomycetes bacterium]|nr:hypothetical protein [Planctomycetota bacterium]